MRQIEELMKLKDPTVSSKDDWWFNGKLTRKEATEIMVCYPQVNTVQCDHGYSQRAKCNG